MDTRLDGRALDMPTTHAREQETKFDQQRGAAQSPESTLGDRLSSRRAQLNAMLLLLDNQDVGPTHR